MNLSNDLVNKFVEITNDETPNKEGSTAYGVTVQYGDRMYVKLDGSDLLTPVETTSAIKSGERVTVLIKDHNATVTGNLSDPSASSKDLTDVGDKIAEVDILIADKVDTKILVAETARIEELIATKASIGQLEADRAEIEHLIANKAEITDLEAINADIEILDAEVADIETLVNGHLTSDNIQSLVLTSDKVTVDDAFIKDAMIANVSANKITSGQINTSLVSISSEDGSMTLNGSTQQFKDSEGTVRIQIGKDAEGNFTFCLFSQDGVGILLDEEGIHAGAVPDGLIVNDMVADNANISGGKLDINSVITSINNGTTTIDSSRIYLDEESQSLKVAFDSLKTKVETIEETSVNGDLSSVMEQITSNTTNINVMQGQISSLISNTTITKENGQVVQLKDEYNSTKATVDSNTTKIGLLETNVDDVVSKQSSLEQNLEGFKTTVSSTYATTTQLNATNSNVTTAQNTANTANSTANSALSKANTNATNITTVSSKQSSLEQTVDNFKTEVSSTYATKDELTGLGSGYVTKTEFEQTSEDFTFKISQSGGANLFRNSKFFEALDYKYDPWVFWGGASQYTDFMLFYEEEGIMYIQNKNSTDTNTGGLWYKTINAKAETTYTYSCNVGWSDDVSYYDCTIAFYDSSGEEIDRIVHAFENNYKERQYVTFTTPTGCTTMDWWDSHHGVTDTSTYYPFVYISYPCLCEGRSAVWQPHSSEIYDGIVKIDKDGLTVTQGNNKSVLDSEALKFYSGTTNYSRIEGGFFKFTDPDGNRVGGLGRSKWEASQNYMTAIHADYGHSVGLGVKYNSTDTVYTDPIWLVSQSGTDTTGTTYSEQGLNISKACIFGSLNYKNKLTDTGFSMQMGSYGAESGTIMGAEQLKLGVSMGNAFIHSLDFTATNFVYTDCYSPINMHGYSIYNTGSVTSLSAQTDYTNRLLNSGSNDYYTYNNMSYYQGEVRWCWKEPVFTYPEADVDPETDEWIYTGRNICYIELPIFMAENIEENYHISIGKIGWGDYRIVEKNPYYFIIESQEEDFAFTFEIVAKLIDSETTSTNAVVANASVQTDATPNISNDEEEFKGLEIPIASFEGYNNIEES